MEGNGAAHGAYSRSKRVATAYSASTLRARLRQHLFLSERWLEPYTERRQEVEFHHVSVVLGLEDVAPGVAVLRAEAGLQDPLAAGDFQVRMHADEHAGDGVGAVHQLV